MKGIKIIAGLNEAASSFRGGFPGSRITDRHLDEWPGCVIWAEEAFMPEKGGHNSRARRSTPLEGRAAETETH